MKKAIVVSLAVALFGLPLLATAAQNFSGAWVKDNAKSDPAPNLMYWLTREPSSGGAGGGNRGGAQAADVTTVVHEATSLTVTTPAGGVQKYPLDGKAFSKTTDTGVAKASISATTQGDTLVITTTQPWGGMPGNATLEIKEVWSLSADGNILTVTTHRNDPAQQTSYKTIYNKK